MKKYKKQNDTAADEVPESSCKATVQDVDESVNGGDDDANDANTDKKLGFSSDYDLVKERPAEKRKVDFSNKLVLSPLTTVGNLPFRRICKEFGADITCGEMACVVPILNGYASEWALTRRHKSEDIFGVQLCGNNAELITYAAQILSENCEIDYIDLNIGCPIELIYQQGIYLYLFRRLRSYILDI